MQLNITFVYKKIPLGWVVKTNLNDELEASGSTREIAEQEYYKLFNLYAESKKAMAERLAKDNSSITVQHFNLTLV